MPRKKNKILSLEVAEINAQWDYSNRKNLKNFICNQEDAEETVKKMDRKELWRQEKNYSSQVSAILAPRGTRNSSNVFYGDEVNIEEVKLPKTVKPNTEYVYKLYDYFGEKLNAEYGTQRDIVSYISKRVKTKYAIATYNGKCRKIENTQKAVIDILSTLESTTSQFGIEPISRSTGDTEDIIIVSIFQNCVK